MVNKIHFLPEKVATQIAAGEVVQNAASVVKELLENALDAGSTEIKLIVKDGGKTLIKVLDNGCGMSEADAALCFKRYTTSKIKATDDLLRLHTYGFRGEALNAIAAVSHTEIISRCTGDTLGTRIIVEEAKMKEQKPIVAPRGTQITVAHLFRNIPVRRNFLKSSALEMKYIIDAFQRAALSRPEVAFSLYQDDKTLYNLPGAKLTQRIVHLFGKHYQKQLVPCTEKAQAMALDGYIGTPEAAKKTRGGQFFFVNERYIRNAYLHNAVMRAFDQLIPPNTYPFYVLFITIPREQVDVNIHPTKTEVRFQEEKLVYATMATSVRKALATHHCMHTIDFDSGETKAIFSSALPQPPASPIDLSHSNIPVIQGEPDADLFGMQTMAATKHAGKEEKPAKSKKRIKAVSPVEIILPVKLQLHKKYILAQVQSGLLVIDQRAAYERILYEHNMRCLRETNVGTQQLLFPQEVVLQPGDMLLAKASQAALHRLGFRFKVVSATTLAITGQPSIIQGRKLSSAALLIGLLEAYKQTGGDVSEREHWACAFAKKATLPEGTTLSLEEMDTIANQLFVCENPNYTPDGTPIWRIIPLEQFEQVLKGVHF